jgi:hypothetical protein
MYQCLQAGYPAGNSPVEVTARSVRQTFAFRYLFVYHNRLILLTRPDAEKQKQVEKQKK